MSTSNSISIVIPVFNCEKYVGKCIKSIQKQTFSDWNLILVDDGSTDGSGRICDGFAAKDSRISVVHQENRGLIGARKTGIANASGEFLAFVDADDFVEPAMLQKLCEVQAQHSADIVCCGYKTVSRRGWIKRSYGGGCDSVIVTTGIEESRRIASNQAIASMWGKLYRKSIFEKAQDMLAKIPDIFYGEDSMINASVFSKADKVILIGDELYNYRVGGGSTNCTENRMHELAVLYRWRKYFLSNVNADIKYHKANLSKVLDMAVYFAYGSKKTLSREKICSAMTLPIADIEEICPNFWHKDAFDLNVPMTDEEFKNIYHESPVVVIKQMLLRIF